MKRVAVLMGGISSEREVSLNTGKGVHEALRSRGYDAIAIDWRQGGDLAGDLRAAKPEAVWIALHGTWGEDGCVQGLLECLRIPYTGSGVTASAIAMDKVLSKRIFDDQGIPTPEWRVHGATGSAQATASTVGGVPCVVKPSREGSTVGVTIVKRAEQLEEAVLLARRCHGETLFERFIEGRELSTGILGDEVLGTVEIRTKAAYYDYQAKYERDDNEYLVPAPLDRKSGEEVRSAALGAYRALGCQGYGRVDVRLDEKRRPWVLEVNTLPGMTATSLLPKIAKQAGLDYATLCERILRSARLHA